MVISEYLFKVSHIFTALSTVRLRNNKNVTINYNIFFENIKRVRICFAGMKKRSSYLLRFLYSPVVLFTEAVLLGVRGEHFLKLGRAFLDAAEISVDVHTLVGHLDDTACDI